MVKRVIAALLAGITIFYPSTTDKLAEYFMPELLKMMKNQEMVLRIRHRGGPSIKFGILNDACGYYLVEENTLVIDPRKECNPLNSIYHELGHFHHDQLSESLNLGNYPDYTYFNLDNIGIKIVSEGMARYFSYRMNNDIDSFKDTDWPSELNLQKFNTSEVTYGGGYHLVKPILDQFGEKGIEYLIRNPPRQSDLLDLPAFQRKTLEQLVKK